MKRYLLIVLFMLSIGLPIASAQESTDVIETPVVTETVAPTAEPVLTEVPAEPEPSPIDEAAIPGWVFTIIVVLVVGVVSIAIVAIIQASKSWPPAAREILLSVLNTGVGELDKVAAGTETEIDNAAVAELRKRLKQLEDELRATQKQTSVNAENIASTNRVVAQQIGNTPA